MTFSDLHVHSSLLKCDLYSSRQDFSGHSASRDPSAAAALLVSCCTVCAVLVAVNYCDDANITDLQSVKYI